jgi:hypothetical protein
MAVSKDNQKRDKRLIRKLNLAISTYCSRDLPEFNNIIITSPADPDPIKLDEDGNVTVLIKTLDGDIRI